MNEFDRENESFEANEINSNIDNEQETSASEPISEVNYESVNKEPEPIVPPVYSYQQGQANYSGYGNYSSNGSSGTSYSGYSANYQGAYAAPQPVKKQKKGLSKGGLIAIVIVIAIICGTISGIATGFIASKTGGVTSGEQVVLWQTADTATKTSSEGSTKTVADVAEATSASVVEIKTEYVTTGSFFGNYVSSGAGSGVIISKDGYIVTNNHVIDDAQKITVTLKSGKEYTAKLIGADDRTDIAVIKIEAEDLSPAVMADSTKLVTGEQIVVVGNPLGELGGSVTTGIISATDREVTVENQIMTLLQIDAAVNPGNSGGALFNMNGELVGIVNAKYSSEEVEGLGFAIPINTAKTTIDDLLEYGYVKGRVQLGITTADVSDLQSALSAGVTELGVYVYSVNEGSGAEKAGLQRGDRIVSIDNKEVSRTADLTKALESKKVGDTVTLEISRNGQRSNVKVTLIEFNPNNSKSKSEPTTQQSYDFGW